MSITEYIKMRMETRCRKKQNIYACMCISIVIRLLALRNLFFFPIEFYSTEKLFHLFICFQFAAIENIYTDNSD